MSIKLSVVLCSLIVFIVLPTSSHSQPVGIGYNNNGMQNPNWFPRHNSIYGQNIAYKAPGFRQPTIFGHNNPVDPFYSSFGQKQVPIHPDERQDGGNHAFNRNSLNVDLDGKGRQQKLSKDYLEFLFNSNPNPANGPNTNLAKFTHPNELAELSPVDSDPEYGSPVSNEHSISYPPNHLSSPDVIGQTKRNSPSNMYMCSYKLCPNQGFSWKRFWPSSGVSVSGE